MPELENQDDSGFQIFFLVENRHLEERKKKMDFSWYTIFCENSFQAPLDMIFIKLWKLAYSITPALVLLFLIAALVSTNPLILFKLTILELAESQNCRSASHNSLHF